MILWIERFIILQGVLIQELFKFSKLDRQTMQQENHVESVPSESVQQHRIIVHRLDPEIAQNTNTANYDQIHNHSNIFNSFQTQIRIPIISQVILPLNNHTQYQNQVHSSDVEKNESQIISNGKSEDIDILRLTKKPSKLLISCNCLKSKCSKNYCQCFTQGRKCSQLCKCIDCENNSQNYNRFRTPMELSEQQRACYCKKSNCLKKYCECYNYGVKCTKNCRCEDCRNNIKEGPSQELQAQNHKEQSKRQLSQQQVQDIYSKVQEIMRLSPQQTKNQILYFLEYWLS